MLVEQRLPLTSKRADVVLAGVDARTGNPRYLVVELKECGAAERLDEAENLVSRSPWRCRPAASPLRAAAVQAASAPD